MRNNQPITGQAHEIPADRTLVSRTDDKGRITEANAGFVRICGFEAGELLGAPHNIVRYPDVPVEAFRDLWQTIKSGRPWRGRKSLQERRSLLGPRQGVAERRRRLFVGLGAGQRR